MSAILPSSPPQKTVLDRTKLFSMDGIEFLGDLPDSSVDLFITDPPYESIEKHRRIGKKSRLRRSLRVNHDWFQYMPNERFPALVGQLYRVLKKNRHCYIFCDFETMMFVAPVARLAGFDVHKPLVWDKVHIGMGYHYRCRYEFVLFMSKGKRPLRDRSIADVLSVPRVHGGGPAEKPLALVRILVAQSVEEGEVVSDPFMGSGVVGEAAIDANCEFLGNDIDVTRRESVFGRLSKMDFFPKLEE